MTEHPTGGHPPTPPARAEYLTCGRSVDTLLEQVADGHATDRDPHQRGCPHCQAALAEYDRLWSPLRELAADKITAPDGVLDHALDRIRNAIENPDYATLPDTGTGVTRIAGRVVVVAARHSAQQVHGVRVALSRHLNPGADPDAPDAGSPRRRPTTRSSATVPGEPTVTAGVAGASTAIEIILAAQYGTDLRDLGTRVRDTVVARVRRLTDLEPVEVTIVIDDVLP